MQTLTYSWFCFMDAVCRPTTNIQYIVLFVCPRELRFLIKLCIQSFFGNLSILMSGNWRTRSNGQTYREKRSTFFVDWKQIYIFTIIVHTGIVLLKYLRAHNNAMPYNNDRILCKQVFEYVWLIFFYYSKIVYNFYREKINCLMRSYFRSISTQNELLAFCYQIINILALS